MLGVKQPTAEVAAVLLKYGVATQHFCYARFLKLSRCGQDRARTVVIYWQ